MKKFAIAAATALSFAAATPALALDVPTVDAYVNITPCFTDCLYAAIVDATDGSLIDEITTDSNGLDFWSPSGIAEFNPVTNRAFFAAYTGEVYSYDIVNETGLALIATNGTYPTVDGSTVGLAIDDSTGTLYSLYNDTDAGHYYVVSMDQTTGVIGTPLELPTSLTDAGASDFAITGGKLYVLTQVGQISVFNLSDGTPAGSVAYPARDFFAPYALDVSEGGVLRVVSSNSDTDTDDFFSYNLTTSTWSEPTTTGRNYDGMAWYGAGSTPAPAPALASTGFDATGLIAGAAALIAAGGAAALRRRVRR